MTLKYSFAGPQILRPSLNLIAMLLQRPRPIIALKCHDYATRLLKLLHCSPLEFIEVQIMSESVTVAYSKRTVNSKYRLGACV